MSEVGEVCEETKGRGMLAIRGEGRREKDPEEVDGKGKGLWEDEMGGGVARGGEEA